MQAAGRLASLTVPALKEKKTPKQWYSIEGQVNLTILNFSMVTRHLVSGPKN